VRRNAAYFLGFIGSAKAVTPLVQLLKDQDKDVRKSAAYTLGSIGSDKAVTPLVQLLKDQDSSVRRSAAEALGSIGSDNAIEHLTTLLNDDDERIRKIALINLGNLSAAQKADKIKNLFKDQKETKPVKLAAAATLLKLEDDQECLKYLEKECVSDDMHERADAAEILGDVPSKKGISLLKTMLNDNTFKDNLRKTIIVSLVRSDDKSAAAHLPNLFKKPSIEEMADFVEDASEIPPVCFEFFKNIVLNTRQYFPVRRMAIMVLGRIKHKDAVTALHELLKNENEMIQYITIVEIGKSPSLHSLPGDLLIQLKNDLKKRLKKLEDRKAGWRKIRDENTDAFSKEEHQQKMDEWRNRLKEVEPRELMEFQLAYAISRIDPENEGIDLLSHDLANVREGAWMGIGTSKSVSLIEKLYRMRKESDIPWFRHAAYRAIDHILIEIEAFGKKKELKKVETLFNKLTEEEGKNFHKGVQTRMQWAVDRLKDSIIN
jgi:HEAT repeat protein